MSVMHRKISLSPTRSSVFLVFPWFVRFTLGALSFYTESHKYVMVLDERKESVKSKYTDSFLYAYFVRLIVNYYMVVTVVKCVVYLIVDYYAVYTSWLLIDHIGNFFFFFIGIFRCLITVKSDELSTGSSFELSLTCCSFNCKLSYSLCELITNRLYWHFFRMFSGVWFIYQKGSIKSYEILTVVIGVLFV